MATKTRASSTAATLVEQVKQHASRHYNDGGWDVIVECWEDADIAGAIKGARTLAGAIKKLAPVVGVWADRQADAEQERVAAVGPAVAAAPQPATDDEQDVPQPTRATWKGHGNPTGGMYYGNADKPRAEGVLVTISTGSGGTALEMTDSDGKHWWAGGVATKFWLAPVGAPTPAAPAAAGPQGDDFKALAEAGKGAQTTDGFTVVWPHGYYLLAKRATGAGRTFEWIGIMSDGNRVAGTNVATAETAARMYGKANGLVRGK